MDDNELYRAFKDKGYNHTVSEALAENGLTTADVKYMSEDDIFEKVLEWNGIIGYSGTIKGALDNIRSVVAQ